MRTTIISALAAAVISAGLAWLAQGWRYDAKIARIQSGYAQSLAQAEQHARAVEQKFIEEIDHVRTTAQSEHDQLRAAADVAAADAHRLRAELARIRRQASRDSTATHRSPGQPDTTATDLLAGMLERMEDDGRRIAQYADELRIAALACRASYEALR